MNVLPPIRVTRSSTIRLNKTPDEIFPMFCPVREVEWAADWDPLMVYTTTGVVEPDCVFVTRDGDNDSVWVVTEHDPNEHRLELVKVTPGVMVVKVAIALEAREGEATDAHVSYTRTALSEEGRQAVEEFSEESHKEFVETWENQLNRYFGFGGRLDDTSYKFE